jgi:hypothetical protein
MPRHRRTVERTGGAAGNERLTAMTGAVLLILLAAEGFTILSVHQMLTLHFFLGMLLVGPVLLKLGSTIYRFARYYTGSEPYVRKGPPTLLLRLLGPVVVTTSVGVIGSGVVLAYVGPGQSLWLLAHKAFFFLWFGAMTIHVLAYAPKLPRLLTTTSRGTNQAGPDHAPASRVHAALAGAGRRWLALTGSLAVGLLLALATYHLSNRWGG